LSGDPAMNDGCEQDQGGNDFDNYFILRNLQSLLQKHCINLSVNAQKPFWPVSQASI